MELELKHLKGYLDCGLEFIGTDGQKQILKSLDNALQFSNFGWGHAQRIKEIKPLLHPLSSLTKEIEHNGERFVPIERINKDGCLSIEYGVNGYGKDYLLFLYADGDDSISFSEFENVIEKLYKWHFNVHNLPDNLFIDKSTVNLKG